MKWCGYLGEGEWEINTPPPSKEWLSMWAKKFNFSEDKAQWPG